MTPHKIFTWKEGKYWSERQLLPISQIVVILKALEWRKECFASIQTYDEFGNAQFCPLYFDFDGKPDVVHKEVIHFVEALDFNLGITPKIYFSGNKGFHIIIDYMVKHPQCHLLVKNFADELVSLKTLDQTIYRTQSLLRIPGSPGSAPGYYKIPLTKMELFNLTFGQIKDLATARRPELPSSLEGVDTEAMEAWLIKAVEALPVLNLSNLREYGSVDKEITPCIQTILTVSQGAGQRNSYVHILARFFKLCGLDLQATEALFMEHEHWRDYEASERGVTPVLRNVFYSRASNFIGCRSNSTYSEIMRNHCENDCHFSAKFPKFTVIDLEGKTHNV